MEFIVIIALYVVPVLVFNAIHDHEVAHPSK